MQTKWRHKREFSLLIIAYKNYRLTNFYCDETIFVYFTGQIFQILVYNVYC